MNCIECSVVLVLITIIESRSASRARYRVPIKRRAEDTCTRKIYCIEPANLYKLPARSIITRAVALLRSVSTRVKDYLARVANRARRGFKSTASLRCAKGRTEFLPRRQDILGPRNNRER